MNYYLATYKLLTLRNYIETINKLQKIIQYFARIHRLQNDQKEIKQKRIKEKKKNIIYNLTR